MDRFPANTFIHTHASISAYLHPLPPGSVHSSEIPEPSYFVTGKLSGNLMVHVCMNDDRVDHIQYLTTKLLIPSPMASLVDREFRYRGFQSCGQFFKIIKIATNTCNGNASSTFCSSSSKMNFLFGTKMVPRITVSHYYGSILCSSIIVGSYPCT